MVEIKKYGSEAIDMKWFQYLENIVDIDEVRRSSRRTSIRILFSGNLFVVCGSLVFLS